MGKRSDFPRRPRDFYPTPPEAVAPLLPHISRYCNFAEPCCGDGALIKELERHGHRCGFASDIEPIYHPAAAKDAMSLECLPDTITTIITNPPWPQRGGEPTVSLAAHLASLRPTWLLLNADFAHNLYFSKIARQCVKIVSVGRVSWSQNGVGGKDNAAWFQFWSRNESSTIFVPRKMKEAT